MFYFTLKVRIDKWNTSAHSSRLIHSNLIRNKKFENKKVILLCAVQFALSEKIIAIDDHHFMMGTKRKMLERDTMSMFELNFTYWKCECHRGNA